MIFCRGFFICKNILQNYRVTMTTTLNTSCSVNTMVLSASLTLANTLFPDSVLGTQLPDFQLNLFFVKRICRKILSTWNIQILELCSLYDILRLYSYGWTILPLPQFDVQTGFNLTLSQQGLLNLERARSTDVFRSYLRFSKRYVDENSTIRFSVKIYTNS
jgi:hypothetical protein